MNPRPVIFVSAVSGELKTARGFASRLLHSLGFDPKDQDMAASEHGSLRAVLRKWIDQSAGVIQLVGARYGREPVHPDGTPNPDPGFGRCSYTQFEARYALQTGKPVWYFFVGDGFTPDPAEPESPDIAALQARYVADIRVAEAMRPVFASDTELEVRIRRIQDRLDDLRRAWHDEQRRARRFRVFTTVALLAILALGIASVRSRWWMRKDLKAVQQGIASVKDDTTALLASMRELSGVLSKTDRPGKPEDETSRLAAAYAELEKKHGLPPGTLARELPRFAAELLARANTGAFDRASALFATGKFAEAEAGALAAKDHALAAAGQPVRDAIAALSLAAAAAVRQTHYAQALAHYHAAAALTDEKRDPLEWANVQWAVASMLAYDGKSTEAEGILKRVIPVYQRWQGAEHPSTVLSRHNLAIALHAQGKDAEAEAELRAVLAIRNHLAEALHAQMGKAAEAEAEHRDVLAIQELVLGSEDPDTLRSRNNLAVVLQVQGKNAEAEANHWAVLATRERVLGAEHPDVAQSCYNLALCLRAQAQGAKAKEKKAEAFAFARRALAIWKKALGDGHPDTQRAQAAVADLEKP